VRFGGAGRGSKKVNAPAPSKALGRGRQSGRQSVGRSSFVKSTMEDRAPWGARGTTVLHSRFYRGVLGSKPLHLALQRWDKALQIRSKIGDGTWKMEKDGNFEPLNLERPDEQRKGMAVKTKITKGQENSTQENRNPRISRICAKHCRFNEREGRVPPRPQPFVKNMGTRWNASLPSSGSHAPLYLPTSDFGAARRRLLR